MSLDLPSADNVDKDLTGDSRESTGVPHRRLSIVTSQFSQGATHGSLPNGEHATSLPHSPLLHLAGRTKRVQLKSPAASPLVPFSSEATFTTSLSSPSAPTAHPLTILTPDVLQLHSPSVFPEPSAAFLDHQTWHMPSPFLGVSSPTLPPPASLPAAALDSPLKAKSTSPLQLPLQPSHCLVDALIQNIDDDAVEGEGGVTLPSPTNLYDDGSINPEQLLETMAQLDGLKKTSRKGRSASIILLSDDALSMTDAPRGDEAVPQEEEKRYLAAGPEKATDVSTSRDTVKEIIRRAAAAAVLPASPCLSAHSPDANGENYRPFAAVSSQTVYEPKDEREWPKKADGSVVRPALRRYSLINRAAATALVQQQRSLGRCAVSTPSLDASSASTLSEWAEADALSRNVVEAHPDTDAAEEPRRRHRRNISFSPALEAVRKFDAKLPVEAVRADVAFLSLPPSAGSDKTTSSSSSTEKEHMGLSPLASPKLVHLSPSGFSRPVSAVAAPEDQHGPLSPYLTHHGHHRRTMSTPSERTFGL